MLPITSTLVAKSFNLYINMFTLNNSSEARDPAGQECSDLPDPHSDLLDLEDQATSSYEETDDSASI